METQIKPTGLMLDSKSERQFLIESKSVLVDIMPNYVLEKYHGTLF